MKALEEICISLSGLLNEKIAKVLSDPESQCCLPWRLKISAWMTEGYKLCEGTAFVSLVLHFQHLERHLSLVGAQWILNTWICWRRWNLSKRVRCEPSPLPYSPGDFSFDRLSIWLPMPSALTPWLSSPPSQSMFGKGEWGDQRNCGKPKSLQEESEIPQACKVGSLLVDDLTFVFPMIFQLWYVPIHREKWEFFVGLWPR